MTQRRLVLPLSYEERLALDDLRVCGKFDTDEDALRSALYSLCLHYGLDVHHDVFAISGAKRKQKSA